MMEYDQETNLLECIQFEIGSLVSDLNSDVVHLELVAFAINFSLANIMYRFNS